MRFNPRLIIMLAVIGLALGVGVLSIQHRHGDSHGSRDVAQETHPAATAQSNSQAISGHSVNGGEAVSTAPNVVSAQAPHSSIGATTSLPTQQAQAPKSEAAAPAPAPVTCLVESFHH